MLDPGAPLLTVYVYQGGKLRCVQEYRRSYMTNIPAKMWLGYDPENPVKGGLLPREEYAALYEALPQVTETSEPFKLPDLRDLSKDD